MKLIRNYYEMDGLLTLECGTPNIFDMIARFITDAQAEGIPRKEIDDFLGDYFSMKYEDLVNKIHDQYEGLEDMETYREGEPLDLELAQDIEE